MSVSDQIKRIKNEVAEQESLIEQILETANSLPEQSKGEELTLQSNKTVTPTKSTQTVTPDVGYDGLEKVTVEPIPSNYIVPTGTTTITENGIYDIAQYASAAVNVAGSGGSSELVLALLNRTLTSYSDETLTKIGAGAFSYCASLTSINLPSITSVGTYGMRDCTSLTEINFPSLTTASANAFFQCTALMIADFSSVQRFNSNAFKGCTVLETLIIRSNSLCVLAANNVLSGTKIENGTGYIYVPRALVDTYKTATNWSTYASQFRAIEDYSDICGQGG